MQAQEVGLLVCCNGFLLLLGAGFKSVVIGYLTFMFGYENRKLFQVSDFSYREIKVEYISVWAYILVFQSLPLDVFCCFPCDD